MLDRLAILATEKAAYESEWRQIGEVLHPRRADVGRRGLQPGRTNTRKIYDSAPLYAVDNFASGLYGMLTSPANQWFELMVGDPEDDLGQFGPVREWRELVTRRTALSMAPAHAMFYAHMPALYADEACFGNAVFYSEQRPGSGLIRDTARSLGECYAAVDQFGRVDTVYREFQWTTRQILQRFQDGAPAQVKAKEKSDPDDKTWIVHAVEPEGEGSGPTVRFPYASIYVHKDTTHVMERGGFEELPYQWLRWHVGANEVYGRGPGELAKADVQSLHASRKTNLKAANYAADPALAAGRAADFGGRQVVMAPGKVIHGGVSQEGKRMLEPIHTGANLPLSVEFAREIRNAVNDAFYFSLLQMVGGPAMTATEWLGRQEERLRMLAPFLGRMEAEFLSPMIKRRVGMLWRAGQLPPPPEEMRGVPLSVHFSSPLAQLQRTQDGAAAMRTRDALAAGAELDPRVLDRFDADAYAEKVDGAYGGDILISREEAEERRDAREQAQQAQALAESAQPAAAAVRDLAGVTDTGGSRGR